MVKSNPYRKPQDAWNITEHSVKLKYPIFSHDPCIPNELVVKRSIKEVVGDIDFWGWEGFKTDRIVDSTGKVFIPKFERTTGYRYWFSILPTEFQSGVFPGEVERTMSLDEIKEIMIFVIDHNKIRIKEDINDLKVKMSLMNSIEDILNTYRTHF